MRMSMSSWCVSRVLLFARGTADSAAYQRPLPSDGKPQKNAAAVAVQPSHVFFCLRLAQLFEPACDVAQCAHQRGVESSVRPQLRGLSLQSSHARSLFSFCMFSEPTWPWAQTPHQRRVPTPRPCPTIPKLAPERRQSSQSFWPMLMAPSWSREHAAHHWRLPSCW